MANSSGLYGARGVRVVIVDSPFDEGAAWCEWAENRTKTSRFYRVCTRIDYTVWRDSGVRISKLVSEVKSTSEMVALTHAA